MKLEDKLAKIVERADGMRKIAETIRGLENEAIHANARLEAIEDISKSDKLIEHFQPSLLI